MFNFRLQIKGCLIAPTGSRKEAPARPPVQCGCVRLQAQPIRIGRILITINYFSEVFFKNKCYLGKNVNKIQKFSGVRSFSDLNHLLILFRHDVLTLSYGRFPAFDHFPLGLHLPPFTLNQSLNSTRIEEVLRRFLAWRRRHDINFPLTNCFPSALVYRSRKFETSMRFLNMHSTAFEICFPSCECNCM